METSRRNNWTKEESTLINEIELAGEILRGSGNSADINNKKRQLWKDIAAKVNSLHSNNRAVNDIRKKWNNLKLAAKKKSMPALEKQERLAVVQNIWNC